MTTTARRPLKDSHVWIYTCDERSVDLARAEVAQVTGVDEEQELAPGVWLLLTRKSVVQVAEAWRTAPPIFVRHSAPVHAAFPLTGAGEDMASVAAALQAGEPRIADRLDAALTFSVQTRIFGAHPSKPFDWNQPISTALSETTGAPLDVREPALVLSLTVAELPGAWVNLLGRQGLLAAGSARPAEGPWALLGVSPVAENLSDWAGGMRRFARDEGQISRSEFKLLEALELFAIALPVHGVALDLGAAPGGWTRVLRAAGQYVTAVDPAELDPRITADKGVRHKRMTAEEYLRNEPDQFDLIVNDMRMDARDSARLMVSYAPQLYRTGSAIMTLKLPEERREPVIEAAFAVLRRVYTITHARQLFHNRSEITLALKRSTPAEKQ
jgi:23S rRNA (cytidine2498-2'-O)-methyltransferase